MGQTYSYCEFINSFINDNYKDLRLKATNDCMSTKFNPDDLLNELVIYLHSNEERVLKVIQNSIKKKDPLLRFCNTWMYNSVKYKPNKYATNFTSKFSVGEKVDIDLLTELKQSDSTSDNIDLHDLPQEHQQKIIFIRKMFESLDPSEKKLYQWHFEENLPHYKIADRLRINGVKVSQSSIYNLLLELRKKIKTEYDRRYDS